MPERFVRREGHANALLLCLEFKQLAKKRTGERGPTGVSDQRQGVLMKPEGFALTLVTFLNEMRIQPASSSHTTSLSLVPIINYEFRTIVQRIVGGGGTGTEA